MHILFLSPADATNRTFEKMVSSLAPHAELAEVVAWDRDGTRERIVMRHGVEHRYIKRGGGFRNRRLFFLRPLWMVRLLVHLLQRRPDVVWAANFDTAVPAAVAALVTAVPFIYYIHDNLSISHDWPDWLRRVIEWVDTWTMRGAATVIVPDENRILPHAIRMRSKFHVLPNTPPGSIAPPLRMVPDGPFTVLATGSLWASRGIIDLLEASHAVSDCRVLVAGRIPEKSVLEAVQACQQADFRSEVPHCEALQLYNEADIVFAFYEPSLPINVRASPTKLYEAMMMGTPVLVNRETMISQKVREWDIGYLCSYGDVEELAEILSYIRDHRAEAAAKGQRARGLYLAELDWRLLEPRLWEIVKHAVR